MLFHYVEDLWISLINCRGRDLLLQMFEKVPIRFPNADPCDTEVSSL